MSPSPEFFILHRNLPREGPGSAADVAWVLDQIEPPARVIDAACGPGADTVILAESLTGAQIDAIDITPHFVEEAGRRVARFGGRVRVRQGDMRDLAGPADLIWCMGALYALGIEVALPLWRKALAPGGVVAFSEPVFISIPPDPVVAEFWADYPGISTEKTIADRVHASGYRTLATRVLTGSPWAEYLLPQEARIVALRPDASAALVRELDVAQREIDLWRQAPDQIAYLLTIAEPA